jgi:hypothetical protein
MNHDPGWHNACMDMCGREGWGGGEGARLALLLHLTSTGCRYLWFILHAGKWGALHIRWMLLFQNTQNEKYTADAQHKRDVCKAQT